MATQKQIEANRRNAQKSTGPKTEQGKAACRLNSVKHGMTAITVVLPHEDAVSYEELRANLLASYSPVGMGEEMLVNLIAVNYWRLLRARRIECAALQLQVMEVKNSYGLDDAPSGNDDQALAIAFTEPAGAFRNVERYQTSIERSYHRAVEALRKAQNDRHRRERQQAAQQQAAARPVKIGSVLKTRAAAAASQPEEPLFSSATPSQPVTSHQNPPRHRFSYANAA